MITTGGARFPDPAIMEARRKDAVKLQAAIAVMLACQLSWVDAPRAAAPATDAELKKQDAVYESRGENVPAGYVVDRSLLAYGAALPAGFDQSLAELGAAERWLDIGAGEGKAILDYYAPRYDSMHPQRRG